MGIFFKAVDSINDRLKGNAIAMQMPIGHAENFSGLIDLLSRKMVNFDDNVLNPKVSYVDIPSEYLDEVEKLRIKIVERACDFDDDLAEKYLNEEEISEEEIKSALRKGVLARKVVPAFCGSAFKNKGVQQLLDAVVEYLPSPLDVPPVEGINPRTEETEVRKASESEPFAALAFKIMTDPFVGVLTFIRVYSGRLNAGSYVVNARTGKKERVSRLIKMHSNKREEIPFVGAGDIAAAVGVKDVLTGDSLCEEKKVVSLEKIDIPAAVISTSVEPKNKSDYEKMVLALRKMMQEDPSFNFSYNEETGQTVISGMGELHLEIIVDRLKREHKVDVVQGRMQVAYKETFRNSVDAEGKFVKQSGGRGQYGHVWIKFEPKPRGEGFEFENKIVGGTIPREFIAPVEKGLLEVQNSGVLAGYTVVDFKASLYDGSYHDVDSSEIAFKVAASLAFKNAMKTASPVLLEPIMKVEVETPEEYMGDVMGDLNSRRGRILGMEGDAGSQIISAEVPLESMVGYATDLRSATKGRATYSMEFECYREVPEHVQNEIISNKNK